MMRDAQRIDHMLGFVRRCLEILDGVDEGMYLSSLDKQEASRIEYVASW